MRNLTRPQCNPTELTERFFTSLRAYHLLKAIFLITVLVSTSLSMGREQKACQLNLKKTIARSFNFHRQPLWNLQVLYNRTTQNSSLPASVIQLLTNEGDEGASSAQGQATKICTKRPSKSCTHSPARGWWCWRVWGYYTLKCSVLRCHFWFKKQRPPVPMLQKAAVVSVEAVAKTSSGSHTSCSEQPSQRLASCTQRSRQIRQRQTNNLIQARRIGTPFHQLFCFGQHLPPVPLSSKVMPPGQHTATSQQPKASRLTQGFGQFLPQWKDLILGWTFWWSRGFSVKVSHCTGWILLYFNVFSL